MYKIKFFSLFFFIFAYFSYCITLKEEKNQEILNIFPDFIKKSNKNIQIIDVSKYDFEKTSENNNVLNLLQDKINIYIQKINIDPLLQEYNVSSSIHYILKYCIQNITKKYPNIEFIFDQNKLNSLELINYSHLMEIRISKKKEESNNLELQFDFTIIRKNTDKIYNFSVEGITFENSKENKIHIRLPENNFIIPYTNFFITIQDKFLETLLQEFFNLGKGKLQIQSSVKSKIQVLDNHKNIVFKGETPVSLDLIEGNYQLQVFTKGKVEKNLTVTLLEKENKNIFLKWEDDEKYTNLSITSNKNLSILVDEEYKGEVPIYLNHLYPSNYKIEILSTINLEEDSSNQNNLEKILIYSKDIYLQDKQYYNLFYPIKYIEDFKNFIDSAQKQFWYVGKNSVFKQESLQNNGLNIFENQGYYTPDILLDGLKGELYFECEECTIKFFFEKQAIQLQKFKYYLNLYAGEEILKRENTYNLGQDSLKNYYIYFDVNQENEFFLYFNTNEVIRKKINSHFVSIGIENKKGIFLLKKVYLSEKENKNFFAKKIYLWNKNVQRIFKGDFQ